MPSCAARGEASLISTVWVKKAALGQNCTWMENCSEAPGAAGLGLDANAAQR